MKFGKPQVIFSKNKMDLLIKTFPCIHNLPMCDYELNVQIRGGGACIQRWISCSSTKTRKKVVFHGEARTALAVFRVSKTAKNRKSDRIEYTI